MAKNYVTAELLRTSAEADESSPHTYWELLAGSVSRLFDKETLVPAGYFAGDGPNPSVFDIPKTSRFVMIPPNDAFDTVKGLTGTDLIDIDYRYEEPFVVLENIPSGITQIQVAANFSGGVPADIQLACIEQALLMWRRKDLTFADLSGVSSNAVTAALSPTFAAITTQYRNRYGTKFFA